MIRILPLTHVQVAGAVCDYLRDNHNVNLDRDKFFLGSVEPDFNPYYKMRRHYLNESLYFVSREIQKLILLCRVVKFKDDSRMTWKLFSRRLGIICHYLMDFTCYPHAYRMTMNSLSGGGHIRYEMNLNKYARDHRFREQLLSPMVFEVSSRDSEAEVIADYIRYVVGEYKLAGATYERDLDFSYSLCIRILEFVFENVYGYVGETEFSYI